MAKQLFNKFKCIFDDLDKKVLKIMKNGLRFSFFVLLFSIAILITYLFFVHSILIYQIGLLVFQLALYFAFDFVISAIAVDSIHKQLM